MCADYTPSRNDAMSQHFGVERHLFDVRPEVFPGDAAPIIRAAPGRGGRVCEPACFGMVPHWAAPTLARSTYNARTETVAVKPSFRHAWQRRQCCIVPVAHFFEPNYHTGKAERWRISHADGAQLGVAGLWEWRPDGPGGAALLSFTMLTVNAAAHPLLNQFHRPTDEKRMVVLLAPEHYQGWLDGELGDAAQLNRPFPADQLVAWADPLPRREPKPAPVRARSGPDDAPAPAQLSLFDDAQDQR